MITSILAKLRLAADTNSATNSLPGKDDSPVLLTDSYCSKNIAFSIMPVTEIFMSIFWIRRNNGARLMTSTNQYDGANPELNSQQISPLHEWNDKPDQTIKTVNYAHESVELEAKRKKCLNFHYDFHPLIRKQVIPPNSTRCFFVRNKYFCCLLWVEKALILWYVKVKNKNTSINHTHMQKRPLLSRKIPVGTFDIDK